jgi:Leucine-rich repeat (LRR) protein
LDLSGNSLSQFVNGQHLTKLKSLNLAKNAIGRVSFQGLQSLEYLSLNNNRIEHLPDMSDLKKLVYLDLSQNRILST